MITAFVQIASYLCIPRVVNQQLGLGDTNDRNIPTQVQLDGCRLRKVACGWWHTLLLGDSATWVFPTNHQILRYTFPGFVCRFDDVHTDRLFAVYVFPSSTLIRLHVFYLGGELW